MKTVVYKNQTYKVDDSGGGVELICAKLVDKHYPFGSVEFKKEVERIRKLWTEEDVLILS